MSQKCRRCGMPLLDSWLFYHDGPDECLALVMAQADTLEAIKDQAEKLGVDIDTELPTEVEAAGAKMRKVLLTITPEAIYNLRSQASGLLAAIAKLEKGDGI